MLLALEALCSVLLRWPVAALCTFILCANALGIWCLELEARGKGKGADLEKELRANVLPGVTIVPAMVIAIEKAQEAGIRYNRQ